MSSVRMCDTCFAVFSENDPDWATMAGSRVMRDPNTGQTKRVEAAMDTCGPCTQKRMGPATPVVPPVQGRYDERYTRQLEGQLEDLDGKDTK